MITTLTVQNDKRVVAALALGTLLCLIVAFASQLVPIVLMGLTQEGLTFSLIGVLQIIFGLGAIVLSLRIANLNLSDIGLTSTAWKKEFSIGIAIAILYTLLQFLIIIPNTGGASRPDIRLLSSQVGDSASGLPWFFLYEITAVFFEELFFRGLFFTLLLHLLGNSRFSLITATAITTAFFAVLHSYQGLLGAVEAGLYGGLLLTLLYYWRGTLVACYTAHLFWNVFAILGVYLWY